MIAVYARIDGQLACWTVETTDYAVAIATVKEALTSDFKGSVLALVK